MQQPPPTNQPSSLVVNTQQGQQTPSPKPPSNRTHTIFVALLSVITVILAYVASHFSAFVWLVTAIGLLLAIGQWLLPNARVTGVPFEKFRDFFAQRKLAFFLTILTVVLIFNTVLAFAALTRHNSLPSPIALTSTPTSTSSVTPVVTATVIITPTTPVPSTSTIDKLCTYFKRSDFTLAYNTLFGDYFHRAVTSKDFVNGFKDYAGCTQVKQVSATEYDITFDVFENPPKTKRFTMQSDGLIYTYQDQ